MSRRHLAVFVTTLACCATFAYAGLPKVGVPKVKVDKEAAQAAAEDKVVKDLLGSLDGPFAEFANLQKAVPDKGVFDVSSVAASADEQMKGVQEQVGKSDKVVGDLRAKKENLAKVVDQLKKKVETAKGDEKAKAEKTLGEVQKAMDRVTAVENLNLLMNERVKSLQGEVTELKALSEKSSKQSAEYSTKAREGAAAAGLTVQ